MKKYKDYIVIIVILLLIFVSISVLFNLDKKTDNVDENVYVIEQDYSNFFTVNSCINKYIQFLVSKDTSSLLKVIDKKYITDNNLNESNVINSLGELNGIYNFVSKEMYKQNKNDIEEYYVKGILQEEGMESILSTTEQYYKLYLYEKNMTYSITPISANKYREVLDE